MPGLRDRDQPTAALGLLGGVGPRRCVEQRKTRDAVGRLTHDRQGHVSAHRISAKRKPGRRIVEDVARNRSDRHTPGVVRNDDRSPRPQIHNLAAKICAEQLRPGMSTNGTRDVIS